MKSKLKKKKWTDDKILFWVLILCISTMALSVVYLAYTMPKEINPGFIRKFENVLERSFVVEAILREHYKEITEIEKEQRRDRVRINLLSSVLENKHK